MNNIKDFLYWTGQGCAYEFHHAVTHFTEKSENVRVLTDLFKRVTKSEEKPQQKREPTLIGKSALNRFAVLPQTDTGISSRLAALDLAGVSFQRPVKKKPKKDFDPLQRFSDPEALKQKSALKHQDPDVTVTREDFSLFFGGGSQSIASSLRSYKALVDQYLESESLTDEWIQQYENGEEGAKRFREALSQVPPEEEKTFIHTEVARLRQCVADLEMGESFHYHGNVNNKSAFNFHPEIQKLLKEQMPPVLYRFVFEDGEEELLSEVKASLQTQLKDLSELKSSDAAQNVKGVATQIIEKTQTTLQTVLPEWWYEKLAENTKDDVLEILLGKDRSDLTAQYAEEVWKRMQEQGIEQTLERELVTILASCKESLLDGVQGMVNGLTSNLPKTLKHCLDMTGVSQQKGGPYWLEVTKKSADTVTIRVASHDLQSELHPVLTKDGKSVTRLPLVFDDVPIEKLNTLFFTRIVTFQTWPSWKKNISYNWSHLQNVFTKFLGAPGDSSFQADLITGNQAQDLLKVLTHHEWESREELDNFFDYVLPFDSLTNFWAQVVQDPTLLEQGSLRAELKSACDILTAKGVKLYQEQKIHFEELETLYATVWEVKEAIREVEEKNRRKVRFASMVIPAQLQMFIKTLLETTGSSEKSIELVKDLCIAVMGEEFSELFDEIIQEIVPTLEPRAPDFLSQTIFDKMGLGGIFPSIEDIKKAPFSPLSALRILGKILNVIRIYWLLSEKVKFTAATLAAVVPQLSRTALGTKGVSLLIVLFGPDAVKNYVPSTLFNTVVAVSRLSAEVYHYIFWRMGMILLRAATTALVKEEDLKQLTEHAKSIHHELTREGEISLETEGQPFSNKEGFKISLTNVTNSSEDQEIPRTYYAMSQELAPPCPELITRDNIVEVLNRWSVDAKCDLSENLCEVYLNEAVKQLPIPDLDRTDLWDEVESPEVVMESIHHILMRLQNKRNEKGERASFEFYERLTTSYTLYAIMDKLARRCPEAKIPAKIMANGVALMPFCGLPTTRQLHGTTRYRFYQVAAYFGLNPVRSYKAQDIKYYKKNRFFEYETCLRKISGDTNDYWLNEQAFAKTPDAQYFSEWLKDPKNVKKLHDRGVPKDLHHYPIYAYLFISEGLLPRPYSFLRTGHMVATYLANEDSEARQSKIDESACLNIDGDKKLKRTSWWIQQDIYDRLNRYVLPYIGCDDRSISCSHPLTINHSVSDYQLAVETIVWRRVRGGRFNFFNAQNGDTYHTTSIMSPSRSASQVMIHGPQSKSESRLLGRHFELIKRFPSDQIVRCMSLMTQVKQRLSMYHMLWLIDYVINDPKAIYKQLSDNPEIVGDWGRFFEDSLDYLKEVEDWGAYLSLASIGQELFSQCSTYAKVKLEDVPKFRYRIREEVCQGLEERGPNNRKIHGVDDGLTLSLIYLVASYYDQWAGRLFMADTETTDNVYFDCARLAFSRSPWHWEKKMGNLRETLQSKIVLFRLWDSLKVLMENNLIFRNRVLDQLARDIGVSVEPGEWTGEYPIYSKGDLTYNLEQKEVLPESAVFDSIEERVSELLKIELSDGVYSSQCIEYPHLRIKVKISGKNIVHIHRVIKENTYRYIPLSQIEPQPKVCHKDDIFWLERGSDAPILLQYRGSDLIAKHLMAACREEDKQVYELNSTLLIKEEETFEEIQLDRSKSGLSLLGWFQPLSSIHTYSKTRDDQSVVSHILMQGVDLSFHVDNGRAYCDAESLSGYYISPVQKEKSLFSYARYLLLENDHQERKVLLPRQSREQLLGEFLVKNLAHLSSSPYVDNLISQILDQKLPKAGKAFYAYSLDSDGRLSSANSEAMFYLALFQLCQGHVHETQRLIQKIEDLGRREPLSSEVLAYLDQMLIPCTISQSRIAETLFLRLNAMREFNVLIHGDETEETNQFEALRWLAVQKKYWDYLTAIELGKEAYLSPYDELFLLRYISRISCSTFKSRFGEIIEKCPLPLEGLVENLVMIPKLAKRYNDLQVQFQEGSSWQRRLRRSLLELGFGDEGSYPQVKVLPADPIGKVMNALSSSGSVESRSRIEHIFDDFRKKTLHPFNRFKKGDLSHDDLITWEKPRAFDTLSCDFTDLTPDYLIQNFWHFYRLAYGEVPIEWMSVPDRVAEFDRMREELQRIFPLLEGSVGGSGYAAILYQSLLSLAGKVDSSKLIEPDMMDSLRCCVHEIQIASDQMKSYEEKLKAQRGFQASYLAAGEDVPKEFQFNLIAWKERLSWLDEAENKFYDLIGKWLSDHKGYVRSSKNTFYEILNRAYVSQDDPISDCEDVRFDQFRHQREIATRWIDKLLVMTTGDQWREINEKYSPQAALNNRKAWQQIQRMGYVKTVVAGDQAAEYGSIFTLIKVALGEITCSEFGFQQLVDHVRVQYKLEPNRILQNLIDGIVQQCKDATPELNTKQIMAKHAVQVVLGTSTTSVTALVKVSANKAFREMTCYDTLRRYQHIVNGCIWGGARLLSAHRAIKQAESVAETQSEKRTASRSLEPIRQDCLTAMMNRERGLNRVFRELLNHYFVVTKLEGVKPEEQTLEFSEDDSALQTFEKLQSSLDDYYKRDPDPTHLFELKEGKNYQKLTQDLEQLRQELGKVLSQSRQNIEQYVNCQKREEKSAEDELLDRFAEVTIDRRDLSFEEIDNAFIQERDDLFIDQRYLTGEQLPLLKQKLYLFHIMASRFNLLFAQLEKLPKFPQDQAVSLIGQELMRKRVYSFKKLGKYEKILRAKLVFESRTKKLLRKKQSTQLDRMLTDFEHNRLMIELLMGLGKTWCVIPVANYVFSVINIWPSATAATNISTIGRQAREVFSQTANALTLSRGTNWTKNRLWALAKAFQRAYDEHEQINMTKESAQAIELCFIELVLDVDGRFKKCKDRHDKIESYRKILLHLRDRGTANGDEAHETLFNNRKELNHPLGKHKRLDQEYVNVVEEVLYQLVNSPELEEWLTVKSKKPSPLLQDVYVKEVLPKLASRLVRLLEFDIKEKDFVVLKHYLMGHTDRIPKFVKNSQFRSHIDLVKGLLTVLLPTALEKTIHVDFNPSKKGNGEQARPSEGNDNPLESSTIRSPYEALVKTGLMLLHDRLNETQLGKFVDSLRAQARVNAKKRGCPFGETAEAKFFAKYCPEYPLETFTDADRPEIYTILNRSDRVVLRYLSSFVANQIHYYPLNLSSNSVNFASMFHSFLSDTGTPYNIGCSPVGTHPLYDSGTDGESLDVMLNPDNVLGIHILESEAPSEVLDEMISKYIETDDSPVRALIDRGAVFNGLSSDVVAREILNRSPGKFRGIAFYQNGELVMLEREASKPVPFHTSTIKPEERLSYFPQPQTFAADIPQEKAAVGVVSIGEDLRFYELAQAIWRMRGLKSDGQKLIFVMTERVKKLISNNNEPTIQEIIAFAARNEERALSQDHFEADKQKLHNVIRSAILDKALRAKKIKELIRIMCEFQDVFVTNLEVDPTLLFGYIDAEVSPQKIFKALRLYYRDRLKKTVTFTSDEKKALRKQLKQIGQGSYSEKVHTYVDGDQLVSGGLDDIGKETHIEVNQKGEEETEVNLNVDLDQDLNQRVANRHAEVKPQKYCPWPKTLILTGLDWLKVQPSPTLSDYAGFSFWNIFEPQEILVTNPPPIYSLRRALKTAGGAEAAEIWRRVSSMILTTNNVTYLAAKTGCPIEPFGPYQVPIYEVLVILQKGKRPKLLLLEQQEAERMRLYLCEDREIGVTEIKMGLVDITTQMIVAYGNAGFKKEDLESADVQRALTQLKFLRGDVEYNKKQKEYLLTWLNSRTQDMENYFKYVHTHHGIKSYEGSVLHEIFLELRDNTQDFLIRG